MPSLARGTAVWRQLLHTQCAGVRGRRTSTGRTAHIVWKASCVRATPERRSGNARAAPLGVGVLSKSSWRAGHNKALGLPAPPTKEQVGAHGNAAYPSPFRALFEMWAERAAKRRRAMVSKRCVWGGHELCYEPSNA